MLNKIIKPGGAEADDFEKSIGQALLELELNSELKPQLRDLHITRAREIEFNNKKVVVYKLIFPINQIINVFIFLLFLGSHYLCAYAKTKSFPKDSNTSGTRTREEILRKARSIRRRT